MDRPVLAQEITTPAARLWLAAAAAAVRAGTVEAQLTTAVLAVRQSSALATELLARSPLQTTSIHADPVTTT